VLVGVEDTARRLFAVQVLVCGEVDERRARVRRTRGEERTLEESRDKLVNLLAWAFGTGDAKFIVVFDGASDVGDADPPTSRVEVRFSRPPDKADDVIRRLVEERVDRVERLTVVTADLEVARHARAMGADIAISDLFLASALGPQAPSAAAKDSGAEKPATLSRKELEEWAELFRRGSENVIVFAALFTSAPALNVPSVRRCSSLTERARPDMHRGRDDDSPRPRWGGP